MAYRDETSDIADFRFGWFVAGAFAVAVAVGAFLYADGYFERSNSIELKIEVR